MNIPNPLREYTEQEREEIAANWSIPAVRKNRRPMTNADIEEMKQKILSMASQQ